MKFSILILTDYQLLNAIRFVYNNCENSFNNTDIFISESIRNINYKVKILKRLGLFSKIFLIRSLIFSSNTFGRKLRSLTLSLNKKSFNKFIICDNREIIPKRYEILMVPCATLQCEIFINYFEHDKIYYIEDGFGSYFGDIQKNTMTPAHRFVNQRLGKSVRIEKLYLNKVNFCKSDFALENCQIRGQFEFNYKQILKEIFLTTDYVKTYNSNDFIYLRQPLIDFGQKYIDLEQTIIKLTADFIGDAFIVRNHPRNRKILNILEYRVDNGRNMWECVCLDNIGPQNVLIGLLSTAQITPKLLFDLEPTVIFLFNLFPLTDIKKQEELSIAESFKKLYKDPMKIFTPRNMDEYLECLRRIN